MILAKDKSNNILCSDFNNVLHYLHPDYVDDKSEKIYSNRRCPLSMLAETCNNIGKIVSENPLSQSQDSNLPISPGCSSSCSAPKFSPRSAEFSPSDHLKISEDNYKEKPNKEKTKKRKSNKRDSQEVIEKRMTFEQHGPLNSPYTISEFLKMNNFSQNALAKSDSNNFMHPFYNQMLNQNLNNHLQSPPMWKPKPSHHPRMPFPVNYQNHNFPMHSNIPPHLFRQSQPNIMNEIHNFYGSSQIDKSSCDCLVCCHKKSMEKGLVKIDPVLYNSLNCLRLPRPSNSNNNNSNNNNNNNNNNILPNLMPPMPHMGPLNNNNSTIKYCMYCGNYIPHIQNLLNHIHTEHVDQISSSNINSKLDSPGNLHFIMGNQLAKEMKSREILKQLHLLYNIDQAEESCGDKPLLMR